jgi:hypothetical protein
VTCTAEVDNTREGDIQERKTPNKLERDRQEEKETDKRTR